MGGKAVVELRVAAKYQGKVRKKMCCVAIGCSSSSSSSSPRSSPTSEAAQTRKTQVPRPHRPRVAEWAAVRDGVTDGYCTYTYMRETMDDRDDERVTRVFYLAKWLAKRKKK